MKAYVIRTGSPQKLLTCFITSHKLQITRDQEQQVKLINECLSHASSSYLVFTPSLISAESSTRGLHGAKDNVYSISNSLPSSRSPPQTPCRCNTMQQRNTGPYRRNNARPCMRPQPPAVATQRNNATLGPIVATTHDPVCVLNPLPLQHTATTQHRALSSQQRTTL